MSEFTKFPALCQELQDMIWDQAIRDDEPAAQFFTLHDVYEADWILPIGLTVPNRSWGSGNKSAYTIDSGLWTACWGSRLRMLHRFRPAETSAIMARRGPAGPQAAREVSRRPTASVTMPFRRDDTGGQCYLTIRPTQDLLYFDFAPGGPWLADPWSSSLVYSSPMLKWLPYLRAFRWEQPNAIWGWASPPHVRHVAVKYDPDWWSQRESRHYLDIDFQEERGAAAGFEVLWFVNYSLRRRYRADGRGDRQTFRAGDDHEFVEVLEGDDEWWGPASSGSGAQPSCPEVHKMALEMEEQMSIDSMIDEMNAIDLERQAQQDGIANDFVNNLRTDRPARQKPHRVGVLAYVKRGSERDLPTKSEHMRLTRVRRNAVMDDWSSPDYD
ncbi:hypothetical protein KVR01_012950 [Diaporthe batatas]|uniref:uncharacterized protein n=1 Tax=Diaporthe batatas TaxID=748121 RepID=UPI001D055584|nr:uncharacterized protein KVR01_012950 [Diaporthe batatas]KAG8157242.1 hypothetical protein KVR01_012950 [Diaporthe batatas]